jgi:hypothetical protein
MDPQQRMVDVLLKDTPKGLAICFDPIDLIPTIRRHRPRLPLVIRHHGSHIPSSISASPITHTISAAHRHRSNSPSMKFAASRIIAPCAELSGDPRQPHRHPQQVDIPLRIAPSQRCPDHLLTDGRDIIPA